MIIGCQGCMSTDCRGCNILELYKALNKGYLDGVMNENKHIDIELLREAVECFTKRNEVSEDAE